MSLGVMLREEQIASPTPLTRSAFRLRSFQREIQNLSLFPRLMCPGQNIYLGKRVFSLCELTCFRPWVMSNWYLNPFPLILNFLYMHFCCYLFVYLLGRMDRTNAACFPRKSLTVAKSTPRRFRTRTEPREPGSCVGAARACAVPSTLTCPGHPEPLGLWEPRLPQLCQQPLLSCASAAGYSWYGVEKVVGARPVGGHTERLWESSSRMFLLSGLSGLAGGMADFRAFRWDVASGCRETGNSCFEAVWTLTSPCVLHKPLLMANSSYEAWARGPSRDSLNAESRSPWRAPRVGSPASGPGPPGGCTGPALARQALSAPWMGKFEGELPAGPMWGSGACLTILVLLIQGVFRR